MVNENEYSTIIPMDGYMQLCACSNHCDVKQSFQTNFSPLYTLVITLFQFLHNNILQAILFVAMHVNRCRLHADKRATINATTDHTNILGAGVQHRLVGAFSDGEWRALNVQQVFSKTGRNNLENHASGKDSAHTTLPLEMQVTAVLYNWVAVVSIAASLISLRCIN